MVSHEDIAREYIKKKSRRQEEFQRIVEVEYLRTMVVYNSYLEKAELTRKGAEIG